MNATMTMNQEKMGIEIRFDGKPAAAIIGSLKDNGFRWSPKQKMWYAKQSEDRLAFAATLDGIEIEEVSDQPTASAEPEIFDLWAMTRTENIGDNLTTTKYQPLKEVAAIIRQHLRGRFPFCKWSVRSDRSSIDIELKSSPFDKDSEENNAIVDYAEKYKESFNWNHSDYYSDYFDVRFYGHAIVDWQFVQTEYPTAETISENFKADKSAFEIAEQERMEKDMAEQQRQREEAHKAYLERQKIRDAQKAEIEAHAEIINLSESEQYFVENALAPSLNKLDSIEEIKDHIAEKSYREDCKVSREVRLSAEDYETFSNMLLEDFSFLDGMGGSKTDDLRVGSDQDFSRMDEEERKTVKWYCIDCVAIYCEDKLMLIIDPQGYAYARYTFVIDDQTTIGKSHVEESGLSREEYEANVMAAEIIADVSLDVITRHELFDTWCNSDFPIYRTEMTKAIVSHGYRLDAGVVRAVENENLKGVLYRILTEPIPVDSQFIDAGLVSGQKITILTMDSGFVRGTHVTYDSGTIGRECNLDFEDAVKLIFKPEGKRKLWSYWIKNKNKVVVLDGWHDIPETLLHKVDSHLSSDGKYIVSTSLTLFSSFDPKQYDIVLDYFKSKGIRPLINTAKPIF